MIAYEELAAALERWRIRNGLPGTPPLFADGPRTAVPPVAAYAPPVAAYAPPVAAYAPPPAPPPAPAPRPAPPIAPPPSSETIDDDLDVLDEDHLDNDGPDFVMGFDSAPAKAAALPGLTDDDAREASLIGGTDPGIVPPPADDVWPEAAGYQPGDATASAGYGWGEQAGSGPPPAPKPLAAVVDDDDDDGGTLVNG
jgi:hypothetical protein